MRFAVIMNMKARKVRQSTIDDIARHVPPEDLFVTRTVEQSDECLEEILRKGYELVFCGGGDGTTMRIVEQLQKRVARSKENGGDGYTMPKIGILKLGTGNGWVYLLEVPPKSRPIEIMRSGAPTRFTPFHMVETEGRLAHLAGVGADAIILNDYMDLKNKFKRGLLWRLANSLLGYFFRRVLHHVSAVDPPRVELPHPRVQRVGRSGVPDQPLKRPPDGRRKKRANCCTTAKCRSSRSAPRPISGSTCVPCPTRLKSPAI
ncbi:MAG: diacylglycerol kinase family protein [Deltaproteobacteria bacterium]|nr:diacylglycerol kinase family protein [Deltaproteobacteria bacterium]